MATNTNIVIKNLDTLEAMLEAYPLVSQMYNKMDFASYKENVREMIALNNFKMVGAFLDDELVGVSGYWVSFMLYCGRYLQVSNFVVDKNIRGKGIGRRVMRHLEQMARDLNCQKFVLDSYTENKKSHPFYFSEGFYIRGFHFMKDL